MKRIIMVFLFVLLVAQCLVYVNPVSGASSVTSPRTIIVPDDFPTIQDAVRNATAGDTVFVKAGNYDIPLNWPYDLTVGSGISLVGENPRNTIITASSKMWGSCGWNFGILLGDNSSISGFNIVGTIIVRNSMVTNNIINLTQADAGSVYGLITVLSGNISYNVIGSAEQGVGPTVLEGITPIGAIGITVEGDTVISNNLIDGFGTGIYLWCAPVKIVNNTFTRNNVGVAACFNPSLFEGNNIVNTTGYGLYAMSNITATYNWWGTTESQVIEDSVTTGLHTDSSAIVTPFLTSPNPNAMPIIDTVTVLALQESAQSRSLVNLILNGNITASQISNPALTNQVNNETELTFSLAGQSGTSGFCNVTIPKTAVLSGLPPTVYIDNQIAPNQGYTQDADNFYVWFTTHFSTHEVLVVFAVPPLYTFGALQTVALAVLGIAVASILIAGLFFHFKNIKKK